MFALTTSICVIRDVYARDAYSPLNFLFVFFCYERTLVMYYFIILYIGGWQKENEAFGLFFCKRPFLFSFHCFLYLQKQ